MFKPIIVALTFVVLSATTHAQVTIIPPDLAPDTSYRLVFVTSTEGLSQSSDLSTYDAIVQAAADANPALDGINWQVIGSTDTVDAEAHTSTNPADPFVITKPSRLSSGYRAISISMKPGISAKSTVRERLISASI